MKYVYTYRVEYRILLDELAKEVFIVNPDIVEVAVGEKLASYKITLPRELTAIEIEGIAEFLSQFLKDLGYQDVRVNYLCLNLLRGE